jgi:hypothetical protein
MLPAGPFHSNSAVPGTRSKSPAGSTSCTRNAFGSSTRTTTSPLPTAWTPSAFLGSCSRPLSSRSMSGFRGGGCVGIMRLVGVGMRADLG